MVFKKSSICFDFIFGQTPNPNTQMHTDLTLTQEWLT